MEIESTFLPFKFVCSSEDSLFGLDHDIALDILYRLPLKSLFRFKCVCKRWLETISGPSFAHGFQGHHCRTESSPALTGFFYQILCSSLADSSSPVWNIVQFVSFTNNSPSTFLSIPQLGFEKLSNHPIVLIDSHHELLLCSDKEAPTANFFVFNPITKKWVSLPQPPKASHTRAAAKLVCHEYHFLVVRFIFPNEVSNTLEIEIFSSKINDWKQTLHVKSRAILTPTPRSLTLVGSTIYWIMGTSTTAGYDTQLEQLHFIGLPTYNGWLKTGRLLSGGDFLVYSERCANIFRMWVRVDGGQWTAKHSCSITMLFQSHEILFNRMKELCREAQSKSKSHYYDWPFFPLAFDQKDGEESLIVEVPGMIESYNLDKARLDVIQYHEELVQLHETMAQTSLQSYSLTCWPKPIPSTTRES